MTLAYDPWIIRDEAGNCAAYADDSRRLSDAVFVPFGPVELIRSDDEETARWRADFLNRGRYQDVTLTVERMSVKQE